MFSFFSGIRLLYVLIPAGVLVAAVSLPGLDILSSGEGCAATETRPCYDQGTIKKVKVLKGESGENAFSACMKNATENTSGMLGVETSYCSEETVSYCLLGNSGNFVRQFDGMCQDEEPVPVIEEVNVSGKFIDAVTKAPLANVRVWDPEVGIGTAITESNASGEFAFTSDTTAVTESNSLYTSYATGCYFQNWGFTSIDRNSDESLRFKAILFDFIPGDFVLDPLENEDVALGDVPLWPATTLFLRADTPVQVSVSYPEENKMLKNSQFQTEHKLWNAIPLERGTTVVLTDQAGNTYESPEITLPVDNGCTAAVLDFRRGEFTWQ